MYSVLLTSNTTLQEIVKVVESLPQKAQVKVLRQAKLEKAKILVSKISAAQRKIKIKVSGDQIADMIHRHREKKNSRY